MRGNDKVKKKVVWYLMAPVKKIGQRDPEEILRVKWVPFPAALRLVQYPSDKKLLKKLKSH